MYIAIYIYVEREGINHKSLSGSLHFFYMLESMEDHLLKTPPGWVSPLFFPQRKKTKTHIPSHIPIISLSFHH